MGIKRHGRVKIVSTMSVDRKRKPSDHPPEGKKKKKTIQTMTPVDCDPVVREVVEDTRAAVEDMMKELNDMVDATPQSPAIQNPKPCLIPQFGGHDGMSLP